jgi:hypothetical protein
MPVAKSPVARGVDNRTPVEKSPTAPGALADDFDTPVANVPRVGATSAGVRSPPAKSPCAGAPGTVPASIPPSVGDADVSVIGC